MTRDDAGRLPDWRAPQFSAVKAEQKDKEGKAIDRMALALRMHRNSLDRAAQFQTDMVRSPAWDVMLSLFIARAEGLDVPLASLCAANRLSPVAGEGVVEALASASLAQWKANDGGTGRQHVELTPRGALQMDQFLQRVALSA